jgi:hypothetical protein
MRILFYSPNINWTLKCCSITTLLAEKLSSLEKGLKDVDVGKKNLSGFQLNL